MIPKLLPIGCFVCGAYAALYNLHLGGGLYDTMPVHIGDTERIKTRVCRPCGETLLNEIIERVIPYS